MADVPEWLESLVGVVTDSMTAHAEPGPMGFRFRQEDDVWDVLIYPLPVELLGGAVDGEVVAPGFSLDVGQLRSAFERLDELHWNAHGLGMQDGEGPYLSFEGRVYGH